VVEAPSGPTTVVPPGLVLDDVVRKLSVLRLSDYYIGSKADYGSGEVFVYFSESAPKETLDELKTSLMGADKEVSLSESDEEGAKWCLKVRQSKPSTDEPHLKGGVSVNVTLSGNVDVSTKARGG